MGFSLAEAGKEPARDLVRDAVRRAFMPRPRISIDRWADQNYVLLGKTSASPGRYSTARTPYIRGVMRAFTDPAIETVTVMKASQLGFTELLNILVLYSIACDPAPMLLVLPNEQVAKDIGRDRLKMAIKACDATKDLLGESLEDQGSLRLNCVGMFIYLAGSGNTINLRSRPIGRRCVDDVDLCEPGTCEELQQRGDTFRHNGGKQYQVGTPSFADQGVDKEYQQSDHRRYDVPCPHCGSYQELVFERADWCDGNRSIAVNPDDAKHTAWVRCIRSSCKNDPDRRILNHHKPAMLERGVWIRDGQRLKRLEVLDDNDRETALIGKAASAALGLEQECPEGYALVGIAKASTHAGFRINSLYSPFLTFGDVIRPYVAAKGAPDRVWYNGRLGRAWRPNTYKVEVKNLEKLCLPIARGGYLHGTCPADTICLTGAVDVQENSLWVQVDAWNAHGRDSSLVWFGQVPCPKGRGLAVLDQIIERVYPCGDGYGRRARCWAVDFAYGERTAEVYDWCRLRNEPGRRIVMPVRGDGSSRMLKPWSVSRIEKYPDGREIRPFEALFLSSKIFKDLMVSRVQTGVAAADGEVIETVTGLRSARRLPYDCPREYLAHMTAEELVTEKVRGVEMQIWKLRAGRRDNHGWDTSQYSEAIAQYAGVQGMTEANIGRFRVAMAGSTKGDGAGGVGGVGGTVATRSRIKMAD